MDTQVTQEPVKELRPISQVYNMEQGVNITNFIDIDVDGEVKSFQILIRNGMSVQQAVAQTEVSIEAYRVLRSKYPQPNGKEHFVPNKSSEKSEDVPAESNKVEHPDKPKRNYKDPVPQGELPVELSEVTVDVFKADFDYFVVEPKPDSKASVKFFKDNLEFAVGGGINNWKHPQVTQFLVPVGDIDPAKAEKYRVAGEVYWVKGAPYTNKKTGETGNYKDIKLVQAVF